MTNKTSKGVAVVTGASTGIGRTYARQLARRGYDLILVARDEGRLDSLADQLAAETGVQAEVFAADLTDRTDLARLEDRLRSDPAITLLVNNAGAAYFAELADGDIDRQEDLIHLNVTAVTRLAAAAASSFARRGAGAIVNVASVVGFLPEYGAIVYGATKAFVLHLTLGLQHELGAKGVRIQAVLPGATRTEIWDRSGRGTDGLDPARVMEADELVAAALAGFDQGEVVTIPSLPDKADWDAYQAARLVLLPNVSHAHPAARYGVAREAVPA